MSNINNQTEAPRPKRSSTRLYLAIILIAGILLSSWYGAAYYLGQRYTGGNNPNASGPAMVNVLVNYGNGTEHWYNSTRTVAGSTFYNMTVSLTIVQATYYKSFHAHLITSINGVASSDQSYWALWIYCSKDRAWMSSNWGADLITPTNNGLSVQNSLGNPIVFSSSALAWAYQSATDSNPSPPVQGAAKVDLCSS